MAAPTGRTHDRTSLHSRYQTENLLAFMGASTHGTVHPIANGTPRGGRGRGRRTRPRPPKGRAPRARTPMPRVTGELGCGVAGWSGQGRAEPRRSEGVSFQQRLSIAPAEEEPGMPAYPRRGLFLLTLAAAGAP